MSDAREFLGTTNDDFVQVRLKDTTLMGCVPKSAVADGFNHLIGKSGRTYPIFVAGMACVVIEDPADFNAADLPEFQRYGKAPSTKRLTAAISGSDEDIGKGV